jgi:hypothetical protein
MMLKARCVSSSVLRSLGSFPREAAVHSSFEGTVNILGDDLLWMSLHPSRIPRHPYCVIIDDGDYCSGGKRFLRSIHGEPVTLSRSRIVLGRGRLAVDLDGASVWEGSIAPVNTFSRDRLKRRLSTLRRLVQRVAIRSPFLGVLLGTGSADILPSAPAGAALCAKAGDAMRELRGAFQGRRLRSVSPVMRSLIGLGLGLTPSGDDFLTGLLAAYYFFSYESEFRRSIFRSLRPVIGCTTLPSSFMLRAALKGSYPEHLTELVRSLDTGDHAGLRRAFDEITAMGATSGQDMLAGVLFWCESLAPYGD